VVELGEGAGVVAVLAEDAASVNVGGSGLEAHAGEVGFVAEVGGFEVVGVLIVFEGSVEVLVGFGCLAHFAPGFGGMRLLLGRGLGLGCLGMRRDGAKDREAAQKHQ
jgi:hypothetical protein